MSTGLTEQIPGRMRRFAAGVFLFAAWAAFILPAATIRRLTGRPPLALGFDREAATYWIDQRTDRKRAPIRSSASMIVRERGRSPVANCATCTAERSTGRLALLVGLLVATAPVRWLLRGKQASTIDPSIYAMH